MSTLTIQALRGADATPWLDAIAQLRIDVFREWPYLYAGNLPYEQSYLRTYFDCPDSIVLLALDDDALVGASTALPLAAAEAEMQAPFIQAGISTDDWLYFGESVVLDTYRGRGLGVGFFAERESHALALGLKRCTFCAVERPETHPAKPPHYIGNERFWTNRGYTPMDLVCHFAWPDIGATEPTDKPMRFWERTLPTG